jgi:hypothetical protein
MERPATHRVGMAVCVVACSLAGASSAAAGTTVNTGVHCTTKADAHKRWETVLGTEPTMAKALKTKTRAVALGFGPAHIEADVRCSDGSGTYEVAQNGFKSFAGAAALARQARAKGLNAHTEDS